MVLIDNIELAKSYGGFMVALGGVSITVLTLVLTLKKEISNPRLFLFLTAALIVATIVCFVGAQGMAETSAIPATVARGARRLYMVASVNVFIAAALFTFSLMLLPRVYDDDMPDGLKGIGFWAFFGLQVGAFAWMVSFIIHLGHPQSLQGLLAAGATALLVFFHKPRADPTGFVAFPFWICIGVSGSSLVLFASTFQLLTDPQWFDVLFYCIGMSAPSAALLRIGVMEYRKELG